MTQPRLDDARLLARKVNWPPPANDAALHSLSCATENERRSGGASSPWQHNGSCGPRTIGVCELCIDCRQRLFGREQIEIRIDAGVHHLSVQIGTEPAGQGVQFRSPCSRLYSESFVLGNHAGVSADRVSLMCLMVYLTSLRYSPSRQSHMSKGRQFLRDMRTAVETCQWT